MDRKPGVGVIGLQPNPSGEYPHPNFVRTLYDQRILDQNEFSLLLTNEW